jgi:hypothetical protein
VADTLSQHDEDSLSINALSSPNFAFYDQFHREAASLPEIAAAHEEITVGMVVYAGHLFLLASS